MEGGGAERVAARLCNYWADKGHAVTLVPTFSGRGDCIHSLHEQVRVEYLADRVGGRGAGWLNRVQRLTALRRMVRDLDPDAVVSFLPHVNVATLLATRGISVPVVVSERIYPPAMPVGYFLDSLRRFTYAWASHVVVQTEESRLWLEKRCRKARGVVIPNPVIWPLPDSGYRVPPESIIGTDRKIVLASGRLESQKGFDLLISAFHSLAGANTQWDLVILGEGKERPWLESLVSALGVEGRVYLPGHAGNLREWYEHAEMFVMSSRFEGFPNALAEAMAHGVAPVSFDCKAGPSDIIRDGVDGLLVPLAEEHAGLDLAMGKLMGDTSLRHRMGAQAAAVRERFSMERIGGLWDALLDRPNPARAQDADLRQR